MFLIDRFQNDINQLKDEIWNDPKGAKMNSVITCSNIAMTMFMGPLPAWITTAVAQA